jgi:chaperonin GroES
MNELIPLYDKILTVPSTQESVTAGGILIPATIDVKTQKLEVLAVGKGHRLASGKLHKLIVEVGDTVVVGKYTGVGVQHKGLEYILVREDEIIAIMRRDK